MSVISVKGGVSLSATLIQDPPSNSNVTGPLWDYELHVKPDELRAAVGKGLPGFDGKVTPYLRVPVGVGSDGKVQRQMVPLTLQSTLSKPGEDVYVDNARFTPAGHEPSSLVATYGIDVYADTDQHGKTLKFPTQKSFAQS